MIKMEGAVWRMATGLAGWALIGGCHETEPTPPHNRDLGDGGMVLMPPASEWNSSAIAKGQADWHPFRDPLAVPPGGAEESDEVDAADATDGLVMEIRNVIAEFNELAADGSVEELLDYFVEDQHEKLKSLLAQTIQFRDACAALRAALESKLPGEQTRLTHAIQTLATGLRGAIDAPEIQVISDMELTVSSSFCNYKFALIDEDWYLEVSEFDKYATAQSLRLDQAMTRVQGWVTALASDQSKPDAVLGEIEQASRDLGIGRAPDSGEAASAPVVLDKVNDGKGSEGG